MNVYTIFVSFVAALALVGGQTANNCSKFRECSRYNETIGKFGCPPDKYITKLYHSENNGHFRPNYECWPLRRLGESCSNEQSCAYPLDCRETGDGKQDTEWTCQCNGHLDALTSTCINWRYCSSVPLSDGRTEYLNAFYEEESRQCKCLLGFPCVAKHGHEAACPLNSTLQWVDAEGQPQCGCNEGLVNIWHGTKCALPKLYGEPCKYWGFPGDCAEGGSRCVDGRCQCEETAGSQWDPAKGMCVVGKGDNCDEKGPKCAAGDAACVKVEFGWGNVCQE